MLVFGKKQARTARFNNSALRALDELCDPGPMVDLFRGGKDNGKKLAGVILVNGIEACLAAGLERGALSALGTIRSGLPKDTEPMARCHLLLQESRAYTQLECWERALDLQNRAMEQFQKSSGPKGDKEWARWWLCQNGYALRLHFGPRDTLEADCRTLVDAAPCPYQEAEGRTLLGKVYLARGETEKARQELERAVGLGRGGLNCQNEARWLLACLGGEEPNGGLLAWRARRDAGTLGVGTSAFLDPEPFLRIYQTALARPEVQAEADGAALLRLDEAAALVNLGRFEEAGRALDAMAPSRQLSQQAAFQRSVLILRILAATGLGRLEEAGALRAQAEALSQENGTGSAFSGISQTNAALSLQIAEGRLEGVEEQVRRLLDRAERVDGPMEQVEEQVIAHMLMARYLLAAGRDGEAGPHLEYVAQNGGKHHFRARAEALLARR